MKAPVAIVRALIRANATLLGLLGARIYPADGVPQNAPRPFVRLSCERDAPEKDLAGVLSHREASVIAEIVGSTEASVKAIADVFPTALDAKSGTVAGKNLLASEVSDLNDSPDGPVDLDDGAAWISVATINLAYL